MPGFESNRFFNLSQTLEKHLICSICRNIYNNAVMSECEHTFCKSCIENWIQTNHKNCPECRLGFITKKRSINIRSDRNVIIICNFVFKQNLTANNIINELKVKCDYQSNGCQEVIELQLLSTHLLECEHRLCKKCGFAVGRDVEHNCLQLLKTDRNQLIAKLNVIKVKNLIFEEKMKKIENNFKQKMTEMSEMTENNKRLSLLEEELNNENKDLKSKVKEIEEKLNKINAKKQENQKILNRFKNCKQKLIQMKVNNKRLRKVLNNKTNELKEKKVRERANYLVKKRLLQSEGRVKNKLRNIESKLKSSETQNRELEKQINEIKAKNSGLISENEFNKDLIKQFKDKFTIAISVQTTYFGTHLTHFYKIGLNSSGFYFVSTNNQNSFFVEFESIEELKFCSDPSLPVIIFRPNDKRCSEIRKLLQSTESSIDLIKFGTDDPYVSQNERFITIHFFAQTLNINLWDKISFNPHSTHPKPDLKCYSLKLNDAKSLIDMLLRKSRTIIKHEIITLDD